MTLVPVPSSLSSFPLSSLSFLLSSLLSSSFLLSLSSLPLVVKSSNVLATSLTAGLNKLDRFFQVRVKPEACPQSRTTRGALLGSLPCSDIIY
jgi:hypothetical protein